MVSDHAIKFHDRKPDYSVGALERALHVLEALAERPDVPLVELAAAVGLNKATAFRHLKVLEGRGYVVQDPLTKRYSLGPRLLGLGYTAHQQLTLPKVAAPAMQALRARFNETVHLGVLIDRHVVHIEALASTRTLTMAAGVGERTFAHISSLGKCLLAWARPEVMDAIADDPGLPACTRNTITSREALAAELARTRERGYAVDNEESSKGARCVGAPIRGVDGEVIAALSLSAPAERLTRRKVPAVAAEVVRAGEEISRRYGWQPTPETERSPR
jgi:DNA-binding IclR family transcriptional regulator